MSSETLSKEKVWQLRKKHLAPSLTLFFEDEPLKIVRGEKHYMYDEKNNKYLDCINNVAHVGHCHPYVTEKATQQMSQLYTNSRYLHEGLSTYAQRLTDLFPDPLNVCYMLNSGSEANDLALQLAHTYTAGTEVISLEAAYHGTVKSCVEVSQHKWKKMKTLQADFCHLAPIPGLYRGEHCDSANPGLAYAQEVEKIVKKCTKEGKQVSAFIMESMVSCGGQVVPPSGYMSQAFKYVREAGGLCIADEVQVGFGRVGTHFWAFEMQDAVPDIVTVGKPMGNGHPVAAVVTTRAIAERFLERRGSYFNTYGGNPMSCAVGHAVLDVIEREGMVESAREVGAYTMSKLRELKERHEIVGDVRGAGLFAGIEFVKDRKTKEPATEVTAEIQKRLKHRLIIISIEGPYDNILKFKPPMTFTKEDVDYLVESLDATLKEMKEESEQAKAT